MIADLKPYPSMKDSGVEWLGGVPEHWEVRPFRGVASARKGRVPSSLRGPGRSTDSEMPYLSMTYLRAQDGVPSEYAEPEDGLVISHQGDTIVLWDGANAGEFFKAKFGIVSSTAAHLSPHNIDRSFFFYACKISEPTLRALTIGMGIPHVDGRVLKSIRIGLPPLPEQTAIVRYLDYVDRRVQRFVRAKQKLIGLLEEEKQAVIHRAVTRGLDPNVPLKDSGVEWLGEVPEHWEVIKIRHFAKVGNGSTPSRSRTDYWSNGHHAWLNSSVANQQQVNEADQFVTDIALKECHLPRLVPGDVLIAITGQGKTRGKSTVLAIDATINQHLSYVHLRIDRILPAYLQLVFTGAYAHLRSISDDSGSTKGALTCADIRHFKVPLPPPVEQHDIMDWVQHENDASTLVIEAAQREIELLREYRTRLIADVVTGKLDVREAAAGLPDAPEPMNNGNVIADDLVAVPNEAQA